MRKIYLFIVLMIWFFVSCTSTDVTVMGVKKLSWSASDGAKTTISPQSGSVPGVYDAGSPGAGLIYGQVISPDSSLVPRAQVAFAVVKKDYTNEQWHTFHTDHNGFFRIENLPFETYKLAATQVHALLTVKPDVEIDSSRREIRVVLKIFPTN